VIELDVVHEGVAWFAWMGSPTVRLDVGAAPASGSDPVRAAAPQPPQPSLVADPPRPADGGFEPVMEMHAVPRPHVEALLQTAGVRLLRVRQEHHCGPRWEAFRYDVTADPGQGLLW
jgi:hypothetical protein